MRPHKIGIALVYALALIGAALFIFGCVAYAQGGAQAAIFGCCQGCFAVLASIWLSLCS